ncbi:response regulator [Sphingomonas sp.]|jgi:CheY-like chemotaxis protein|uniref:response regulator n=1 Tax=Sphingomonas sp. TaxID=28214 RepID=UPI002D7E654A|nr:response regulator [Sphingomonas sp.]HEU0045277.1 response regulator [Sphingomonas sp.]
MSVVPNKGGVVLVVDDEPLIRMNAADMLADAGWIAIEAANAAEALVQLAAHPEVTVLFTDINMPGEMDGLDLARRVHDLRPDVHLIITSGKMRPRRDELPGGGEFLGKPYREGQFLELLQAVSGS